ncbi:enolase C-terminal domain-like protein [Sphingobium tyrosinilyticum]|uniref:L-fuconate dehydratase n=1 Tax=Sphingobium tyrosinilyticum TaxID=2715436 RepID=A0ABV9F010_9SPHN
MNPDPDYSAAYVVLETDRPGMEGHGFTFTIGRGNELCVAAIASYIPLVVGKTLEEITTNMAGFWRVLAGDSQLRWTGPEKGVIHLGLAAIINAIWDLWAKVEGKPVWRLVSDLTPERFVSLIDFRHIQDAITPEEAIALLREQEAGKAERIAWLEANGYPAYTTSAGWLGYDDDKMRGLLRQAMADGWKAIKIKVGVDVEEDVRRSRIVREEIGPDKRFMVDANQVWEVHEAAAWMERLAEFNPWFIEEPLSPDDILGHAKVGEAVRPIRVATGEHCHNRTMFKQFFQADAIDVVQLDGCRLGGLNEVLAVLLLAAKFGKPVCPHAGGVGLCEVVQHISAIDYVAVSGTCDEAMTEYAAHLHEHFVDPAVVKSGRYVAPSQPGYSTELKVEAIEHFRFPDGLAWA